MSAADGAGSGAESAAPPSGVARGRLWARFRRSRLREPMRRAALLAMRPYAGRQDALNAEILRELERQGERLDRLEEFTRELVLASESLRRELQTAWTVGGQGEKDRGAGASGGRAAGGGQDASGGRASRRGQRGEGQPAQ
ncbi:MAG: hypothetical protein ACYCU0_12635 [Solirubrobacteraceae bacterium]